MKRERNDGCFQYLWLSLGPFLRTEFQCLKRTMKASVVVRVRSVFIIKQRHSLSCNKRLCSRCLTEDTKSGGRSEVTEGAGGSHLGNSAHCGDYWHNIHNIYLLCRDAAFKSSIWKSKNSSPISFTDMNEDKLHINMHTLKTNKEKWRTRNTVHMYVHANDKALWVLNLLFCSFMISASFPNSPSHQ